jgi:hypothetical protein
MDWRSSAKYKSKYQPSVEFYDKDIWERVSIDPRAELCVPIWSEQEEMSAPRNASEGLCVEDRRDIGGAIVREPPDSRSQPVGFNAEYFSSEGLVDPRVAVITVRRAANRSKIMYIYIAPSEVLHLTPLKQTWPEQLSNLGNIIQAALCRLHITGNRRPIDQGVIANGGIALALVTPAAYGAGADV